jgi:replicative DNA helicase
MAVIRRRPVDTDIEKKILTGLIVSDRYCQLVHRMLKKEYFTDPYSRMICVWVQNYFKSYQKAPGKAIQQIYEAENAKMKDADASLVSKLLTDLSSTSHTGSGNWEYLADKTRDYFRKRSLTLLSDGIQSGLARGDVDNAEAKVRDFAQVKKGLSVWFNPFDRESVQTVMSQDNSNALFSFTGRLGEMVGPFERDWLISLMGPMKRGKSWYLQDLAMQALSHRCKVVFFSLEMNREAVSKRIYKMMTGMADREGSFYFPVFDCVLNQDGTCTKPERMCTGVKVKEQEDADAIFRMVRGYRPCDVCRIKSGDTFGAKTDYRQATWKILHNQVGEVDTKIVLKKARDFKKMFGNNLRVVAYPAFSATFDDLVADLDDLEAEEGFVPDVVCVDYFDIMAIESRDLSERGNIDRQWKRGKGLAGQRHCLVATVSQSNRESIDKISVKQENTAEDIRKLAHVDIMLGLNQVPDEKERGIMRISLLAHRHKDFSFNKDVVVLQSLELGQPFMDSEWCTMKAKIKKKKQK